MTKTNRNKQIGKVLIKHLDLGNGRYIENDHIIDRSDQESTERYMTWDELWAGVKSDITKIRSHLLKHKTDETD